MLVKPDTSHKKEVRTRQRASTSCTECRRRKQKCNQAKDRPCNNCVRRYPPVPCTYQVFRKSSKYQESVIELDVTRPKTEDSNPEDGVVSPILPIRRRSTTSKLAVSQVRPPPPAVASPLSRSSSICWVSPKLQDFSEEECVSPEQHEAMSEEEDAIHDLSPTFRRRKFQNKPEQFLKSLYGVTKTNLGGTAVDPFMCLPAGQSRRDMEFVQFFVQRLAPYMSSIDGVDPPHCFHQPWVSFMIQSPIIGYIPILSSAYFYATCANIDIDKSVEAMTARVKLIHLINDHIASHRNGIDDEVIATVMSLAHNELIYTDERSTAAHMRGLADMIRTRGGLDRIEFRHLQRLLIRTDFHVALIFECDLFLPVDDRNTLISVLDTYPLELDNPLLLSRIKFVHSVKALGISNETAALLDDMRLLTAAVIHLGKSEETAEGITRLHTTAEMVHGRLTSSYSDENSELNSDYIYQTCRTAAKIYCNAIRTRTRFSKVCTSGLLQQLWSTMWKVPLPTWKKIPGIFLWLLLIANPYARDKPESRFLKGLTPATTMAIGLSDWDVATGTLRACLAVQRFVGGESRGAGVLSSLVPRSLPPEHGLPAWAMSSP